MDAMETALNCCKSENYRTNRRRRYSWRTSLVKLTRRLKRAGIAFRLDHTIGPRGGTSNKPYYLRVGQATLCPCCCIDLSKDLLGAKNLMANYMNGGEHR